MTTLVYVGCVGFAALLLAFIELIRTGSTRQTILVEGDNRSTSPRPKMLRELDPQSKQGTDEQQLAA